MEPEFPRACTHSFENNNFKLQGLQIDAFQQRYTNFLFETPYLEGELVPKTCKIINVLQKNSLVVWSLNKRTFSFSGKTLKKNKIKLMVSKKVADQSHFGSNIESLSQHFGWDRIRISMN